MRISVSPYTSDWTVERIYVMAVGNWCDGVRVRRMRF